MEKLSVALLGDARTCWDYNTDVMPNISNMKIVSMIEAGDAQEALNALAKSRAQAVVLCMPIDNAQSFVEHILKAKLSIFSVSPVVFNSRRIANIRELLKRNKLFLQIGIRHVLAQEVIAIKREIDKGNIGDIKIIRITNRSGHQYSPSHHWVKENVLNDFELVRYFNQGEIKSVYATSSDFIAKIDSTLQKDIDASVITLQMEGGTLCIIDSTNEVEEEENQRVEVYGSHGYRQWEQKINKNTREACLQVQLEAFAKKVLSCQSDFYNDSDDLNSVATAIAAQMSYSERRVVSLCEIMGA